jgi:hypothetical protein
MLHPRRILIFLGALILIFGGYSAWRASHPPLDDTQQLTSHMETMRAAVESRDTRTLSSFLAADFSWNGQNKRELNSMMTGTFMQARDITANITGLKISFDKTSAITTGKFSIAFRPSPRARSEAYVSDFTLVWQKQNGNWLVVKAVGGENIQ